MTGILAIETATEACSVALLVDGKLQQRHELAPRRHSQLIFEMFAELVPRGDLAAAGVTALAYGSGPGSFTGLRIAASAVQGLAFSTGLPAVGVSSLAVLAQTALRDGVVAEGDSVLATLDARINEVYSAVYTFDNDEAQLQQGPWALPPAQLALEDPGTLVAVGSGAAFADGFPDAVRDCIAATHPEVLPQARDLATLARAALERNEGRLAVEVAPMYVRDEINWKKLGEQGPST